MKILSPPCAEEVGSLTSAELRDRFLIESLFVPGQLNLTYTNLDRLIVGSILPEAEIVLPGFRELGTSYFTERREIGVLNIGQAGMIAVGEESYGMNRLDCLYIGTGEERVTFASSPGGQAAFYLLSAPAHRKFPTRKAAFEDASVQDIGSVDKASKRRLVQYIHENGIESCQLVMGFTELEPGSVWNTWPPHTHLRRSEIYLYFDLGENLLVHLMGEPSRTRHLIVRDRQAVLSPPWSIHCGAGTSAYRFIWGMAGENKTFTDMDPADPKDLK
jgi:4-deoxy-L-threo-5-hexosulose-uronate ketol-isomerase